MSGKKKNIKKDKFLIEEEFFKKILLFKNVLM